MTDDPTETLRRALRDAIRHLLVLAAGPVLIGDHEIVVTSTGEWGCDSGRPRYRVACRSCGVVEHESATAPALRVVQHVERPL